MSKLYSLLLFLALGGAIPASLHAATVTPQTFHSLQEAERLLDRKQYARALQTLEARLQQAEGKLERSLLLRAIASAQALQGNYRQASASLEKALASKALPVDQQKDALLTLGQLYLAAGKPGQAIATLEQWLRSNPRIRPEDHALLAQAHTQIKHYRKALHHLNQAISQSGNPRDEWLQLRLGLNFQLRSYRNAIADLKILIHRHPLDKGYWEQLAGVYQLTRQQLNAAAILELKHLLGLAPQEAEILQSVGLLRSVGIPYLAADRLQEALNAGQVRRIPNHLDLLASTWIEAREFKRAIRVLTEAARLRPDGRVWMRLAQLYVERGEWQAAIAALHKSLAAGGLKKPGQGWLLLGNAYFEAGKPDQALTAFGKAAQYPSTHKTASEWLNYLRHLQTDQGAESAASSAAKAG